MKIEFIKNNKNFLIVVFVLLIIFVIFLAIFNNGWDNFKTQECKRDEDCVKQKINCCPCEMGGEEICMNRKKAEVLEEELDKKCKNIVCIALYNCKKTSCKCIEGRCVER